VRSHACGLSKYRCLENTPIAAHKLQELRGDDDWRAADWQGLMDRLLLIRIFNIALKWNGIAKVFIGIRV
jgi:hypothetical protein